MGQKVSPNGLRFGINKDWISRWNAPSDAKTAQWLVEDEKVRLYFMNKHKKAGLERLEIERSIKSRGIQSFVTIAYLSQPGIILGKENKIDEIEKDLKHIVGRKTEIKIIIKQSANPATSARLIAREIADGIENRVSFRVAQKTAIKKALTGGALGIKTKVSGRLGGAEIARDEGYSEGVVPLSTLRADIDYAFEIAHTTYGVIGVKVWINRGLYYGKGFMPVREAQPRKGGFGSEKIERNRRRHPVKPRANNTTYSADGLAKTSQ